MKTFLSIVLALFLSLLPDPRPAQIITPAPTAGGASEFVFHSSVTGVSWTNGQAICPNGNTCPQTVFAKAHTLVRFTYNLQQAAAGCTTAAQIGIFDSTSSSTLTSSTLTNGQTTGFVDSGALSVATTAGHVIDIGLVVTPAGCTTSPTVGYMSAVFQ